MKCVIMGSVAFTTALFPHPTTARDVQWQKICTTIHMHAIAIILLLVLLFGAVRLHAQTGPTSYYVSPGGNDSNPGTELLPWRTLAKAASMATAGVTIFIKQGTYNERLLPANSGTSDRPIIFACYPGDSVVISGAGIKFPADQSNSRWWNGLVHIQSLKYITIAGLRVINSGASGVVVNESSNITIEKNYTDSTYSPGIVVNTCDNVVVDSNEVVHGCLGGDQECISFMTTTRFEIRHNRVHDGFTEGIDVKVGSSHGMVSGNEVYRQSQGRSGIYIDSWDRRESNIDVCDNISHDNGHGFAVGSENGGLNEAITIHHNKAYGNSRGLWLAGWGVPSQKHLFNNIEIYGNEFSDNDIGIEVGGYPGTTMDSINIYNNVIYRNKGVGVRITRYDGPSGEYAMRNVSVINNTVYRNGTMGNGWDADNAGMNIFNFIPVNMLIRNNILSNNAFCTIYVSPEVLAGSLTIDYNYFDGFRNVANEKAGTNAFYGISAFVDSVSNDYHLQLNSPCIDKGSPAQEYNDPSDPNKPGYALYPALGTVRNDMGAYGGPGAASWTTLTAVKPLPGDVVGLPRRHELLQNYPNPFNPSTTIRYGLPERSHVSLAVYNTLGQQVMLLVNGEIDAGYQEVTFNASNLPSGVYFYRLQGGNFVQTRKLCLVR